MKRALIIGVTGQDGIYLAEHLLELGYKVYGVRRPSTIPEASQRRMKEYNNDIFEQITWIYADLADGSSLRRSIEISQPDYIYNLGAQSHVRLSFEVPEYTADINAVGFVRLLDAVRALHAEKNVSIYQASTSEMFGNSSTKYQNLSTPFNPLSPYASAKLYAHNVGLNYAKSYGMKIRLGILFNHESPLRGTNFVTRKITRAVANRSVHGVKKALKLGNLDSRRDWGYAKEYVQAMNLILEKGVESEYIVATKSHESVRSFLEKAYSVVGINISWEGKGVDEVGICSSTGDVIIKIDPWFYRPNELDYLCGDFSKIKHELGWEPKTTLNELIELMVQSDIYKAKATIV